MRLVLAAMFVFSCSAASAFPVQAPKEPKVGTDCTNKVFSLYPKLQTCSISGEKKSRVWCPNRDVFDLDETPAPKALARSLCGLPQVAE